MNIKDITYPDINNGLGCRISIWVSGCIHHCLGCQNQHTWDEKSGREFTSVDKEEIFRELKKPYIKGVTFTGGDPLSFYPREVLQLAEDIKRVYPDKDIWLYTGFTLEELKKIGLYKSITYKALTCFIDYIVDGKFEQNLKDTTLAFRGSSNQKIYQNVNGEFQEINLDLDEDFNIKA